MPQTELSWLFSTPATAPVPVSAPVPIVSGPTVDPSLFYPDDEVIVIRQNAKRKSHDGIFVGKVVKATYASKHSVMYVVQSQTGYDANSPVRPRAQFGHDLFMADAGELKLHRRGSFVNYLEGSTTYDSWFDELAYLAEAGFAEQVSSFKDDDPWTSLNSLYLGLNANRVHAYDTSFNGYEIYLPNPAQALRLQATAELEGIRPDKGFLHPKKKDRDRLAGEYGYAAAKDGPV